MAGTYNPLYDYVFTKPDKSQLEFIGHNMKDLISNVQNLIKEHYDLEYSFNRHTVYNIMHRPDKANAFYKAKLKITKHIANKATANTDNSSSMSAPDQIIIDTEK